MKKEYISPELEVVKFTVEDIIVTSFTDGGTEDGNEKTAWGKMIING